MLLKKGKKKPVGRTSCSIHSCCCWAIELTGGKTFCCNKVFPTQNCDGPSQRRDSFFLSFSSARFPFFLLIYFPFRWVSPADWWRSTLQSEGKGAEKEPKDPSGGDYWKCVKLRQRRLLLVIFGFWARKQGSQGKPKAVNGFDYKLFAARRLLAKR